MLLLSAPLITSNAALIIHIEWRGENCPFWGTWSYHYKVFWGEQTVTLNIAVILMHCPQGLCDLEGLFSCKRITTEPGDQPLFLFVLVLSIPNIPARIFWGKCTIFSLYAFCPAKEIEWWEDASVLQVSCFLHTTMSVLMGPQIWSFFLLSFPALSDFH